MRRTSFNDSNHAHFLTFSCYKRRQLLTSSEVCTILARTLDEARQRDDFALYAYVFMPEHVHLLIHPRSDAYAMAAILRDIKEPFSRQLLQLWRDTGDPWLQRSRVTAGKRTFHRVWQAGGGFDRNLYNHDAIRRAVAYIEHNPVRRGLVREADKWEFSSARARSGATDVLLSIDEWDG